MSANNTQQREVKKERTLRKKLTLNSQRISPLEKDTIISSFFVCFLGEERFSRFSLLQKEVSLTQTHIIIDIQFLSLSLSLSFSLLIYKYIHIGEQQQRAQTLLVRARIHVVARAPLTARVLCYV